MIISKKIISLSRIILINYFSSKIPYYIVNEYPKSGGSWLGQMIGDLLDIPFPRNRFPILKPSIMHGHYLRRKTMHNVVILWRDGRDVMVSWYHHCLFKNEIDNHSLVKTVTNDLQLKDINAVKFNLPEFIEYSFEKQKHPSFSWATFVNSWINQSDVVYLHYEKMRENPVSELQRVVQELTSLKIDDNTVIKVVDKYSFAKMSKRVLGQENKTSFMRKGIVGDWKNYFSQEACEIFSEYAGSELIQLGYEDSSDWVRNTF